MTAIEQYQRLEAIGLWRETAHEQRKEVIVSFGNTTLILSDINNRPLSHWSLAALQKIGTDIDGDIFAVDPIGDETLEISDPTMLQALAEIKSQLNATRPHPGRFRWLLRMIILAIFLWVMIIWIPQRLPEYATGMLPDSKAVELGGEMIQRINQTTGSRCYSDKAEKILRKIEQRIIQTPSNRIHIADLGSRNSLLLPGGHILLNYNLITKSSDPFVLAGYILKERATEDQFPPLDDLFSFLGFIKTFHFLIMGEFSNQDIYDYADHKISTDAPQINAQELFDLFQIAKLPHLPYAKAANETDLIAIPSQDEDYPMLLSDSDWIILQDLCQ